MGIWFPAIDRFMRMCIAVKSQSEATDGWDGENIILSDIHEPSAVSTALPSLAQISRSIIPMASVSNMPLHQEAAVSFTLPLRHLSKTLWCICTCRGSTSCSESIFILTDAYSARYGPPVSSTASISATLACWWCTSYIQVQHAITKLTAAWST